MAPKAISLAYAGKKLTGPPEGYGRKKELQVKHWISGMPDPNDTELPEVASVATLSEVDGSREELYRSLRDSTDGYGLPLHASHGGKVPPFPEPPRATVSKLQAGPGPRPGAVPAVPGAASRVPDGRPMPDQHQVGKPQILGSAGGPAAAAGAPGRTSQASIALPTKVQQQQQQPVQQQVPDLGAAAAAAAAAAARPQTSGSSKAPQAPAKPPGALNAGAAAAPAAPSRPTTAASGGREAPMQAMPLDLNATGDAGNATLALGLLLARVDATAPPGLPVEERFRRCLQIALEEQQLYREEVRKELAAVRALAADAHKEAQQRATDAEASARRAVEAEAELGRVRGEVLALRQAAQQATAELEDRREDRDQELAAAKAQLQALATQLQQQAASNSRAVEMATADANAARGALLALQREVAVLRRGYEVDKVKLEAQIASISSDLQMERASGAVLRADHERLAAALQAERAARQAAEDSERKALRANAKQVEAQEAVQAAQAAALSAKQRAAMATQRATLVRAADPGAAALSLGQPREEPAARSPRQSAGAASATPRTPSRKSLAPDAPSGGQLPAAASSPPGAGVSAADAATARADGHRALARGLQLEQRQLGELLRAHKRAAVAAEMADAVAVEAALAAAPEHLKALGLAFRAYLVAGQGGAGQGSGAAQLAAKLGGAGYRVYVDPMSVQAPSEPLLEMPSAPLVSVSAAMVVVAVPSLLRQPLALAELAAAARYGNPLLVLAPGGVTLDALSAGELPPLVPAHADLAAEQYELALEHMREAWPSRLELPAGDAAAKAVAAKLGLPDAVLAAVPAEALKLLAPARGRAVPDLSYLNSPLLQQLRLKFPPPSATQLAQLRGLAPEAGEGAVSVPGQELVQLLEHVLQGNSCLTSLVLRGCTVPAAQAITQAVLASPVCRVTSVTINCRVPLAELAGCGPGPLPAVIDFPGPAPGSDLVFLDEDAAVVAAALQARAALQPAPEPPLAALSLPQSSNLKLSRPAVAALVSALVALPGLQSVNGVPVDVVVARLFKAADDAGRAPSGGGGEGDGGAVLDLSGSHCGPVVVGLLLGRVQAALASLAALNLTGCMVGPVGGAYLEQAAAAARSLPQLHTACLADNWLGPEGVQAVLGALTGGGGASGCHVLDLSLNSLGDVGCKVVCRALPGMPALLILALAHNGIGGDGARALAAAIPKCPSLQEVLLAGNQLSDMGVRELATALKDLPRLQVLHLQDNFSVGGEAALGLALALAACTGLRELDLSRCQLGNEGVRHMAQAIGGHPSLASLGLAGCKIRAEGAAHLAPALAASASLTHLDLSRNQLGDRGAAALADALARNRCLRSLDVRSNSIGLVGCRSLAVVLRERNDVLRALAVAGNEMEDDYLAALEDLAASQRVARPPLQEPMAAPAGPAGRRTASRAAPAAGPGPAAGRLTAAKAAPLVQHEMLGGTRRSRTPQQQQPSAAAPMPRPSSASPSSPHQQLRTPRSTASPRPASARDGRSPPGPAAGGRPSPPSCSPGSLALDPSVMQLLEGIEGLLVGRPGSGGASGNGARGSTGGGGGGDEELEALLSRYRTGQAGAAGPLIDLGYTGMTPTP